MHRVMTGKIQKYSRIEIPSQRIDGRNERKCNWYRQFQCLYNFFDSSMQSTSSAWSPQKAFKQGGQSREKLIYAMDLIHE